MFRNVVLMPKAIQLRNVPNALHRRLKARAAREGMSLSAFVTRELRHVAERPSLAEIRARLAKLPAVTGMPETSAEAVRAARSD
jgi:plasmid stability protein